MSWYERERRCPFIPRPDEAHTNVILAMLEAPAGAPTWLYPSAPMETDLGAQGSSPVGLSLQTARGEHQQERLKTRDQQKVGLPQEADICIDPAVRQPRQFTRSVDCIRQIGGISGKTDEPRGSEYEIETWPARSSAAKPNDGRLHDQQLLQPPNTIVISHPGIQRYHQ